MPAVAIPAAMAVVSAASGADSSRRAANTQADAARSAAAQQAQASREANALQASIYQQNMMNSAPQLRAGQQAQAALMGGFGFDTLGQNRDTFHGAPVPGGTQSAYTPQEYGINQDQATDAGNQFRDRFTQQFAPSDLTLDPSYQFRLQQGSRNLAASAAARGGLLTGQGGVDLQNYGQQAASQEYGAAFDRFRTQKNDLISQLAGISGLAAPAAASAGGYGQSFANQVGANTLGAAANSGNALMGAAGAQAQGTMGQANAWNSALRDIGGSKSWGSSQGLGGSSSSVPTQAPSGYQDLGGYDPTSLWQ